MFGLLIVAIAFSTIDLSDPTTAPATFTYGGDTFQQLGFNGPGSGDNVLYWDDVTGGYLAFSGPESGGPGWSGFYGQFDGSPISTATNGMATGSSNWFDSLGNPFTNFGAPGGGGGGGGAITLPDVGVDTTAMSLAVGIKIAIYMSTLLVLAFSLSAIAFIMWGHYPWPPKCDPIRINK